MGVIELNGIFRAKNKTAAQWASENPILRDGEFFMSAFPWMAAGTDLPLIFSDGTLLHPF